MAFVKKTWEDRISEYPNRRTINDGNTTTQVTVGRDEGVITQAGDAFDATNMNNLEERIADAVDSKAEQADTYTKAEVDSAIANAVEAGVKTDNYADLDTVDKTIIGAINEVAQSGGGGGSTTNYNLLTNKPSINGHELKGDSDTASLNLDYDDLLNKPVIPDVSGYYDKTEVDNLLADKADVSDLTTNYYDKTATDTLLSGKANTSDIPDMTEYYDVSEIDTLFSQLATVASTGDYDDLINKPTIPFAGKKIAVHQVHLGSTPVTTSAGSLYVSANKSEDISAYGFNSVDLCLPVGWNSTGTAASWVALQAFSTTDINYLIYRHSSMTFTDYYVSFLIIGE